MKMASTHEHSVPITPELVKNLAAMAGVSLSDERAEALAPQAAQQFALLRTLDDFNPGHSEPMAEFRLDRQRSAG
jgi:Asp-tRNA(Asn)/Glu-tRNA(Gln) amidotransferase C subunit